jgi:hypothetical protein
MKGRLRIVACIIFNAQAFPSVDFSVARLLMDSFAPDAGAKPQLCSHDQDTTKKEELYISVKYPLL